MRALSFSFWVTYSLMFKKCMGPFWNVCFVLAIVLMRVFFQNLFLFLHTDTFHCLSFLHLKEYFINKKKALHLAYCAVLWEKVYMANIHRKSVVKSAAWFSRNVTGWKTSYHCTVRRKSWGLKWRVQYTLVRQDVLEISKVQRICSLKTTPYLLDILRVKLNSKVLYI